ncbi:MAG: galactose oxidase-like domain-containing protein [Candidatus Eisenbacteria bacterium]
MIVFGGATSYNGTPSDQAVYELRFNPTDPAIPTWHTMIREELGDGQPAARLWHTLSADSKKRTLDSSHQNAHAALLYGGKLGNLSYSDELWALWLFTDGTYGWKRRPGSGTAPGARARHGAVLDPNQGGGRLYVYGGETSSGSSVVSASSRSYIVDTWGSDATWKQWADLGFSLKGHTATLDPLGEIARIPEVYDPATNSWTAHGSVKMFQGFYPAIFAVPGAGNGGSRVININTDNMKAYRTDFPASGQASQWTALKDSLLLFRPKTGVQYRPGKIMLAGGSDAEDQITGRTLTFDAAKLDSPWVVSQAMQPRNHHNLVLLPTGQVLAVGGNNIFNNVSAGPVKRPQIWTPGAFGNGSWTSMNGSDRLTEQTPIRGDHSTALLLPDGRILSAGGESNDPSDTPARSDKLLAELFCPPYLFKSDGMPITVRPSITGAPSAITWGTAFSVCVADTAKIRSACLMRPGATTHSMDMNQRFIPLTIQAKANPPRLNLNTPASPDSAPPGDYLLFVLGSDDGAEVPSIARWVRVNSATNPAPEELVITADLITCDAIGPLRWAAPSDNGCASRALDYEVRYSFSPITSGNFNSATYLAGSPDPATGGTSQTAGSVTGLSSATLVYFAGRTRSSGGSWSPLAYAEFASLSSCGGGGYGTSAGRSRDELGGSRGETGGRTANGGSSQSLSTLRPRAEQSSLAGTSTLRLVAEFDSGETLRWRLHHLDLAGDDVRLAASARCLVLEEPAATGGWEMRDSSHVGGGLAGVRSLPRSGRLIFPAGTMVEALESAPRRFAVARADHSQLGEIATRDSARIELVLAPGDTLDLDFRTSASAGAGDDCVFLIRLPGAAITTTARRSGRAPSSEPPPAGVPQTEPLPGEFALHPARPNPFSGETTLRFDLPTPTRVRIDVFDVQGRRVAQLLDEQMVAGRHTASWNGRFEQGSRTRAGVYLCRITAGAFVAERRITLVP